MMAYHADLCILCHTIIPTNKNTLGALSRAEISRNLACNVNGGSTNSYKRRRKKLKSFSSYQTGMKSGVWLPREDCRIDRT